MEAAGLIRRLPDPSDRRGTLIEPTEAGHAAWDKSASTFGIAAVFWTALALYGTGSPVGSGSAAARPPPVGSNSTQPYPGK